MTDKPISAAELVRKTRRQLTRYANPTGTLAELSGLLDDVRTIGGNDAWVVVRPVDGLDDYVMATATIPEPTPEIDSLLERIGPNGRIELVGMAVATKDKIAKLRIVEVQTVNGTPTATPRPARPAPESARRRWWQVWRNNENRTECRCTSVSDRPSAPRTYSAGRAAQAGACARPATGSATVST